MFEWPRPDQHTLILGSTGTGKTTFGLHLLSNANIQRMPYVILDYKREELVNAIPYSRTLDFKDTPKEPGVYILRASPGDDQRVEDFLLRIHAKERVGLFYDEAYMLSHMRPFRAVNTIYTQGRSKNIQTITLTQRPAWISRYAYSEATHIAYMRLNHRDDRKTIEAFLPQSGPQRKFWNIDMHPPKYHVKWYDGGRDESYQLLPAPEPDAILQRFEDRLRVQKRIL